MFCKWLSLSSLLAFCAQSALRVNLFSVRGWPRGVKQEDIKKL